MVNFLEIKSILVFDSLTKRIPPHILTWNIDSPRKIHPDETNSEIHTVFSSETVFFSFFITGCDVLHPYSCPHCRIPEKKG